MRPDGTIYVAGSFSDIVDFDPGPGTAYLQSAGGLDAFLLQLTASGAFGWVRQMGGTGNDYARGIDVREDGGAVKIYVTGSFEDSADFGPDTLTSAGESDGFLTELDGNGNFLTSFRFGGSGAENWNNVAVDSQGSTYVSGQSLSSDLDLDPGPGNTNLDATTVNPDFPGSGCVVKLDTQGNYVWSQLLTQAGGQLTTDADDNLYHSGKFNGTADLDFGPGTFVVTAEGQGDKPDGYAHILNSAGDFVTGWRMGGSEDDGVLGLGRYRDPQTGETQVYTFGYFQGTADFQIGQDQQVFMTATGDLDAFLVKTNVGVLPIGNRRPVRIAGSVNDLSLATEDGARSLGLGGLDYSPGTGEENSGQTLTYEVTAVPPASLGDVLLADGTTVVTADTHYTLDDIRGLTFRPTGVAVGAAPFTFTVTDNGTTNGKPDPKTLTEGLTITVVGTSVIQGSLFDDLNSNNIRDSGEPTLALAGLQVYLDRNGNGGFDAADPSTVTDAAGNYTFTGLLAGTYRVAQVPPAGYMQTSPAPTPGRGLLGEVNRNFQIPGLSWYGRALAWSAGSLFLFEDSPDNPGPYLMHQLDPETGQELGTFLPPQNPDPRTQNRPGDSQRSRESVQRPATPESKPQACIAAAIRASFVRRRSKCHGSSGGGGKSSSGSIAKKSASSTEPEKLMIPAVALTQPALGAIVICTRSRSGRGNACTGFKTPFS